MSLLTRARHPELPSPHCTTLPPTAATCAALASSFVAGYNMPTLLAVRDFSPFGRWPPKEQATTHVIGSDDWPSVDWPMHIMTNGSADPSTWTGEGSWGAILDWCWRYLHRSAATGWL